MNYQNILISFEHLLNSILNLDPQKQFLLKKLKCHTLGLELYDLNCTFYFTPSKSKIKITKYPIINNININKLCGSSGMIIGMLMSKWSEQFIKKKKVRFTGNIKILYQYKSFFNAVRPNLLLHFSDNNLNNYNPVVNVINRSIKIIQNQVKNRMHDLPKNIITYLQEELSLLPCKEEIEDFFDDITLLKQNCDRVEKKICQLRASGLLYAEN